MSYAGMKQTSRLCNQLYVVLTGFGKSLELPNACFETWCLAACKIPVPIDIVTTKGNGETENIDDKQIPDN